MRSILRISLVAYLSFALLNLSAFGAPDKPLGVVLQAQVAQLDGATAANGATVFAGDTLTTEAGGSLRIRLGIGQVYLLSSSAVSLADTANGVSAALVRGTAGFSSSGEAGIELRTDQAVIRAKSPVATHGRVTIVGPNELIVSSYKGPLEVEVDGELYTIGEGNSYRVVLDPDPQGPHGVGTKDERQHKEKHAGRKRSKAPFILLIGAAVAGGVTSYYIIKELTESETEVKE